MFPSTMDTVMAVATWPGMLMLSDSFIDLSSDVWLTLSLVEAANKNIKRKKLSKQKWITGTEMHQSPFFQS